MRLVASRREQPPAEEDTREAASATDDRPRHNHDYLEFESTCESQGASPAGEERWRRALGLLTPSATHCADEELPDDPVIRTEPHAWEQEHRRSYQQGGPPSRYGDSIEGSAAGGAGRGSEWTDASKDAQAFLRKQTEQAYDFAKKISIEDAKKGATETAKKAKKWGGSLLSSISASISSAASSVKVCQNTSMASSGGSNTATLCALEERHDSGRRANPQRRPANRRRRLWASVAGALGCNQRDVRVEARYLSI